MRLANNEKNAAKIPASISSSIMPAAAVLGEAANDRSIHEIGQGFVMSKIRKKTKASVICA